MENILKRNLAPITETTWKEIENQAKMTLKQYLTARKIVDFNGPKGWDFNAVGLGTLKISDQTAHGANWGIREVLPLVELRVPFKLNIFEMDNISRGLKNPELDPVAQAAQKVAMFEESAIYYGFSQAGIQGIREALELEPVMMPDEISDFMPALEEALNKLRKSSVGGPFTFVVGNDEFKKILAYTGHGYPLNRRIKDLIQGDIIVSPAMEGGLLISTRGGDFEMTVGQDLSIGYQSHTQKEVELYFVESFTFQVLDPAAVAFNR